MSTSYVVLCEADRERLGAPERLPYDLMEITAGEQGAIQVAFGYHEPADIADAMRALVDDERNRIRVDHKLYRTLIWLGLRQAGLLAAKSEDEMAAELAGLRDIKISRTVLDFDEDAEGKDDSSTPTETSTP